MHHLPSKVKPCVKQSLRICVQCDLSAVTKLPSLQADAFPKCRKQVKFGKLEKPYESYDVWKMKLCGHHTSKIPPGTCRRETDPFPLLPSTHTPCDWRARYLFFHFFSFSSNLRRKIGQGALAFVDTDTQSTCPRSSSKVNPSLVFSRGVSSNQRAAHFTSPNEVWLKKRVPSLVLVGV